MTGNSQVKSTRSYVPNSVYEQASYLWLLNGKKVLFAPSSLQHFVQLFTYYHDNTFFQDIQINYYELLMAFDNS